MRRFVLKLALFLAIIVALDFAYGICMDRYRQSIRSGVTGLDNQALYHTTAPVLVFGSSRAWHHYDPRILRDSLGLDVFNCGVNSMGIQFFYPRLRQILRRYTPRVIIYDSSPTYDCLRSTSDAVTARRLQPYFLDPDVYPFLRQLSVGEWVKCHSATYRYHDRLADYRADAANTARFHSGYQPLPGTKNAAVHPHDSVGEDPAKVALLRRFIHLCHSRGIRLIFVVSPYYRNDQAYATAILHREARRAGVPVIDRFADPDYINDSTLFFDESHLNADGADRFTRSLVRQLRPCL